MFKYVCIIHCFGWPLSANSNIRRSISVAPSRWMLGRCIYFSLSRSARVLIRFWWVFSVVLKMVCASGILMSGINESSSNKTEFNESWICTTTSPRFESEEMLCAWTVKKRKKTHRISHKIDMEHHFESSIHCVRVCVGVVFSITGCIYCAIANTDIAYDKEPTTESWRNPWMCII